MNITSNMDLNQLAERMGNTATQTEAEAMRDLLVEAGHEGRDTSEIAESEWAQHLCQAVEMARNAEAQALGFDSAAASEEHQQWLKGQERDGKMARTIESPAYAVTPTATADEDAIIARALAILEKRVEGKTLFDSPKAVSEYLIVRNGARPDQAREVFSVLYLDAMHRLIECVDEFTGTLSSTSVYPREIVRAALARNAAAVILCHNHPSGMAEPSRADENLTQTLKSALALVDVRVLDHFITAGGKSKSMAEMGLV